MARAGGADDVVIRGRALADDEAIRRLNDDAFEGPDESRLVDELRGADLAAIELVAVEQMAIVGHILFSALGVTLDAAPVRALSLAPMSVRPGHQRRGIGSALVRAGLARAGKDGWHAVIVLGHPHFYPRFGFSTDLARPLAAPFSGDAFMGLELVPDALRGQGGRVVYPPPFGLAGG